MNISEYAADLIEDLIKSSKDWMSEQMEQIIKEQKRVNEKIERIEKERGRLELP